MKRIAPFLFVGLTLALWALGDSGNVGIDDGANFLPKRLHIITVVNGVVTTNPTWGSPIQSAGGLTNLASVNPTNKLVIHGEPLSVTNYVELVRIGLKVPGQWFNQASRTVVFSESNDILTNTVNLLVSSGQFCAVRGHTRGGVTCGVCGQSQLK